MIPNAPDPEPGPTEITVISGKGGTGKTSITASLALLAGRPVIADCDVDAADLHLVLTPRVEHRESFSGSRVAAIRLKPRASCPTSSMSSVSGSYRDTSTRS